MTTAWLKQNVPKVLDWPANSPDLNPIENAWYILKRRIQKRKPKPIKDLKLFCMEEWENLDMNFFHNLVDSMSNRIDQVIRNKGGRCDY